MSGTDTRAKATKKMELPVFVTAENRSKLMEIYNEAIRHWPVPFETSFRRYALRQDTRHREREPCVAAAGASPSDGCRGLRLVVDHQGVKRALADLCAPTRLATSARAN